METDIHSCKPNSYLLFIKLIAAVLLPVTVLFMTWAIQRGVNITDEGVYLIRAQRPADVIFGLTSYHQYTSILFHNLGQNIIMFRLVRLVMEIIAGAVLYIGLSGYLQRYQLISIQTMANKVSAFSILTLGSMFAYFWFLPSPSYNSLNSFALTVSAGLFLLFISGTEADREKSEIKARLILVSIGLCIGFSFFVKFTTACLLFTLYSVLICVTAKLHIKSKIKYIGAVLFGVIIWLLLHFTAIQPPEQWLRYFLNGRQLAATMSIGYDASSLTRYLHEVSSLGIRAACDFWVLHLMILLGVGGIRHFNKTVDNKVVLNSFLFGAVFFAAVALSIYRHLYAGGQSQCFNLSRFYFSWLLLLMTSVLASTAYSHISGRAAKENVAGLLPVGILLFCLPFAGSIGTINFIYINLLLSLAPWFGLLLLLSTLLSQLQRIQWIAPVLCTVFSLFASVQIITGCLYDPYRLLTGLNGQTLPTAIGFPPTTLKLDPATNAYFVQLKALALENGFKPGDDILGFYDLPGVVYALGGRSPGLSWYMGNPRKSPIATAELALSKVDRERLKHAFILQDLKSDRIMPDLGKFGLNFPEGYMLCGEINNPYDPPKGKARLWKPL